MSDRIFLSAPDVRQFEREYVMAAIDSNWLAPAGPDLNAFEEALATASGRQHALCLSSGTAALQLALLGVGVKPGDEVICSTLTFIGSAGPIVHVGANPVFIDSELDSWDLSPELLEAELQARAESENQVAAVVAVDLYGVPADYDKIVPICEKFGVPMISDAAEALGASYNGAKAGSFGQSAILSFNGNKIITSSGGGALVSDDADFIDRARYLSTQARQQAVHYEHTEVGFNFRMSNIVAALGRAQLATLPDRIERRREIYNVYADLVANIDGVEVHSHPESCDPNHWLTCVTISPGATNSPQSLIAALEEDNIESRPVWKPMHLQPVFADAPTRLDGTSETLFANGVCLPSGSGMSDANLERVILKLKQELAQ